MGVGLKEAKEIALASLEQVGASSLINKVPNYLSGGQKRLVSIAGIIAMKPKVIAMDEPTADLDAVHAGMIERIIRSMRDDHGNSVVIATHDLNIAARLADRVCVLKGGSIIADGSPREIFYDRGLLEDAGLKPPKAVELYRRYCEKKGKEITKRPLTDDELLMALDGCNK
jgi:cobalt/nickel transport system ATP-binding protein